MRKALVIAALSLASVGYAATVAEIREMLNKQEYQQAIREADRSLVQQDPVLDQQEIYDLIVLKAEALLRHGNRAAAANEFVAAARAAPDVPKMAWARASRLAIARSTLTKYTPRTGDDREPMDIVDPDARQRVFLAIARDEEQRGERAFRVALESRTLPELEDAAEVVGDIWLLKLASIGKAEREGDMLRQISERARAMITEELAQLARQVAHLDRLASSYDLYGGRRGVSSRERSSLRELDAYLEQVNDRVRVYRDVAIRIEGDPAAWDRLLGQIVTMQSEVELLLGTRY